MAEFKKLLAGGDLRSIGKSKLVISEIKGQKDFDELFKYLFDNDRLVVMRAADAIEKITAKEPTYLTKHKKEILKLCSFAKDKELMWHLALLTPRLHLNNKEFGNAWDTLTKWAMNKTNSRIVRVNSVQGLSELLAQKSDLAEDFELTLVELEKENVPSINARIRKIKKQILKRQVRQR